MKLFRQEIWGQWEPVFQNVAEELQEIVSNHKIGNSNANHKKDKIIPVIIPFYKNKTQLDKCIAHLNKQTTENVEIFIRDNSNDNIYFTAAVNEGIRKYLSKPCKYILVLNQDMYLKPSAVQIMIEFMNSHPKCGIGAPLQLHTQNTDYVICGGSYEAFPLGKHQHGRLSEFTKDKQILWCNGACMILRKEMIREIGLLDENFLFIGSDSDYCFTAQSRGWQIWTIVGAKGIHEHGASGLSGDRNIEIMKINDMIYFGKKWLTGELYKEMAYEGNHYTPEIIEDYMNQLREAKKSMHSDKITK